MPSVKFCVSCFAELSEFQVIAEEPSTLLRVVVPEVGEE